MQWLLLILVLPYLVLLFWIFLNLRRIKPFNPTSNVKCFLSVIIACRDESHNVTNLLSDIVLQDYPADLFEVIFVDDNSGDSTFKIASGFTGIKNLIVLRNKGQGKKMAISTGVDSARGELVLTTDADCSMGKTWISTIASFYIQNKPDMIISPVMLESGHGFFRKFQELEFLSLQGVTAGTAVAGAGTMCNGANLAYTRNAFLKHSENLHFEIPSGDDVFLLHSLKKDKGSRIMWLESMEAAVTVSPSESFSSFFSQRSRWLSKGKAYNDIFTVSLAIVTFVTIIILLVILIYGFFSPRFLLVFSACLALKSIPDFLILLNTAKRYEMKNLMKWFIPIQLVYPFYVLGVVISSFRNGLKFNPVR